MGQGVKLKKEYVTKEALHSHKLECKLLGLVTFSPTLGKGIALCVIDVGLRKEDLEVEVEVRGKKQKAFLENILLLKNQGINSLHESIPL
ncbi:hypothetical protein TdN_18440 [Thermodesulfovibrio sp. TK110]